MPSAPVDNIGMAIDNERNRKISFAANEAVAKKSFSHPSQDSKQLKEMAGLPI